MLITVMLCVDILKAECLMLNLIMLSGIKLDTALLSFVIPSVIMFNDIMLCVIQLRVVILSSKCFMLSLLVLCLLRCVSL
jgi:hypothetical protein